MKNQIFLWLCLVLLLTQSCSKEDSLSGAYSIETLSMDCPGTADDFNLVDGNNDVSGVTVVMDGSISFTAAGTYTMSISLEVPLLGTFDNISDNGTYDLIGNSLTTCSANSPCETSTINLSTGRISMSTADGNCIINLTGVRF